MQNLDSQLCVTALEYVLTLLGSQSLLALKDVNLSQRERQIIKREISISELSTFHEFVKKRILAEVRDPLHRKKHGISVIRQQIEGRDEADRAVRASLGETEKTNSMRIRVTRRMHLHTHQTPPHSGSAQPKTLKFNMTHDISGIGESPRFGEPSGGIPSSTPSSFMPKSCLKRGGRDSLPGDAEKRPYTLEEEPIFFDPEEPPTHHEWSYVNLVEEDYFHFLSNLFSYICQTE